MGLYWADFGVEAEVAICSPVTSLLAFPALMHIACSNRLALTNAISA